MADETPVRAKRPRYGGRRDRSDEVVAAAAAAFAASGYNNTSLADIAATLGMTPAGILHRFRLKENLLTAVLQARDRDDVGPEVYEVFPRGQAYLDHLVRTMRANAERPGIARIYTVLSAEAATQDHPAQEWFRDRYRGLRATIDDAVRTALDLPDGLMAEQTATATNAIIATMDGLQLQWLLDPDSVDMPRALERMISATMAELRLEKTHITP